MRLTGDGVSLVGAQTVRAAERPERPATQAALVDQVASMTVSEVRDAIVAGEMTAQDAAEAELAGRRRTSILTMR